MLPESTLMPLQFLRPLWLLGLFVIPLFLLIKQQSAKKERANPLIAPHLSKQLVSTDTFSKSKQLLLPLLTTIACIALSGPSWRSLQLPVYEMQKAQVLVLNLSYSMYATDIKPNRVSQAKYKAIDLIKQWGEGEKALIAYAGEPFTISPLTPDGNSIINHIASLSPDIMPVTGSNADIALEKAIALLQNANYQQGHIVFISDGIDEETSQKMLQRIEGTDWIVSMLAVGTSKGAPIKLTDGTLLKDQQGDIVIPTLQTKAMYAITKASDGLFLTIKNTNSDIKQLGNYFSVPTGHKSEDKTSSADQFPKDDGYWIAFLLLPLFLLLFRKGLFYIALLGLTTTLVTPPAAQASIWQNNQQNAYQAYQEKNYDIAAELYKNPNAKGSALYQNKQYQEALEQYNKATRANPNDATAFYNQGNALAQLQELDKAITAYEQALKINPTLQVAADNKKLIEELQNQQQQNEQQQNEQQQNEQQQNEQQQNEQQQNEQQQNEQQQNEQQQNEQQQNEQQQNEQQQNEQQQNEQQQNEQQQNEQQQNEQQQNEQQQNEQQHNEQQQNEQQQNEQQQNEQQQNEQQQNEQQQNEPQQLAEQENGPEKNQELEDLPMWLKNMPDDPALLLRNKMRLEYHKRAESKPVKRQNSGDSW